MTDILSIEVEQALIGGLLIDNKALDDVSDLVDAADFFEPVHQDIFEEIRKTYADGGSVSPIALARRFEGHVGLEKVGGGRYINKLAVNAVTVAALPQLARSVSDMHKRRRLQEAAEYIGSLAEDTLSDADYVDEAEKAFASALESKATGEKELSGGDALGDAIDSLINGKHYAMSTGIDALDETLGGIYPQKYYCLAGRTSMGKTALALSLARNVARAGHGVLIISMEMTKRDLMIRMACDHTYRPDRSIHYSRIAKGKVNASDIEAFNQAKSDFDKWPLVIDDVTRRTVHSIRALARRTARKMAEKGQKLELVVIDYLGIIKHDVGRSGSMVEAYAHTSVSLKEMAKEDGYAVLALHQVNRATEGRDDKRPQLSDLRHSGDIEQDVDSAIFIFREHYYLSRQNQDDVDQNDLNRTRNLAEIIIPKNRGGETGTVSISCDIAANAFRDVGVI